MPSLLQLLGDSALFQSRIPLKPLALVCRSLSTLLHSGVAIDKAFRIASSKLGDPRARRALEEIATDLRKGNDVAASMRRHGVYFPELLIDMVSVAEQTGALPEVLAGLADHYDNTLRLRRTFLAAIAWPVIQLVVAILVIALLIFVLGIIAESNSGEAFDVLGWGLLGASGALTWLGLCFGSALVLFIAYQILSRGLRQQEAVHSLLMKIPVVGGCLQAFAIARFSWALYLTQEAGMPIGRSLQASLDATANGAFRGAAPQIIGMVNAGEDLTVALRESRLFPADFLHMVDVAETTGTVPEALHRLSPQFEDQARRSLAALTAVLGWGVWLLVAAFIIFVIFSIALWYVGMINDALKM